MRSEGLLFASEDGRSCFLCAPGSPPTIVGRRPPYAPQNVRVPSRIASREHVCIRSGPNGFTVEDAGSTGGAYIDGERICGPQKIGPGVRLQLTSETAYRTRLFAGESLYTLICAANGPALDLPGALRMARAVLQALRPLHSAGEVHGNLDWHHVLRDDSGVWVVIIDGWTVLAADGTLNCNPSYVAPDVWVRRWIAPGSDLYTVGLLCFEAAFGYRPFERDDVHQHMLAKMLGGPLEWRGAPPPADVQAFFCRLLRPDPEERGDINQALEPIDLLCPDLRSATPR